MNYCVLYTVHCTVYTSRCIILLLVHRWWGNIQDTLTLTSNFCFRLKLKCWFQERGRGNLNFVGTVVITPNVYDSLILCNVLLQWWINMHGSVHASVNLIIMCISIQSCRARPYVYNDLIDAMTSYLFQIHFMGDSFSINCLLCPYLQVSSRSHL